MPRQHKYRAIPTVVDGIRFASKLQARLYGELVLQRDHGDVAYFLMQAPIHLPGGGKLVVDFLVVHRDGRVRYIDAKGVETAVFKAKRRVVEALYPIRIETWPK